MKIINLEKDLSGLFIIGTIIERTKRFIGESNSEVVLYLVTDGRNTFYINHWHPSCYYDVGYEVCLPITIKSYIKNEKAHICYTVKQEKMIGEEF